MRKSEIGYITIKVRRDKANKIKEIAQRERRTHLEVLDRALGNFIKLKCKGVKKC